MRRATAEALQRLAALHPAQLQLRAANAHFSSQAVVTSEPETIIASQRLGTKRHNSARLRKQGMTPAIIFSLPGNTSKLITIEGQTASSMMRVHGRRGLAAQRYNIEVAGEHFPVLPRVVHINAVSNLVENMTFMYCPPGRQVSVPVPVQVIGEDACPGVKQNGFPYLIRRSVDCSCPGDAIPAAIEVDISGLNLGQTVLLSQLTVPAHVKLIAKHPQLPVCKIAGKGTREG